MRKICIKFLLLLLILTAFTGGVYAKSEKTFLSSNSEASSLQRVNSLATDYEKAIWNTFEYAAAKSNGFALNSEALQYAVTTNSDWLAIGCARFGYYDNLAAYLNSAQAQVTSAYASKGYLHRSKVTEYQRLSVVVAAAGGNPAAFGNAANGEAVNLLADGIYNCIIGVPWELQPVNGVIWALLAINAKSYPVPADARYGEEALLANLLDAELAEGGFALTGTVADPDISGMALFALAPYYQKGDNAVDACVDRTLNVISRMQKEDGTFSSWGYANAEGLAQVLIALCTLGIDPLTDSRFINNGHTVLDALEIFYNHDDGGFWHLDPRKYTSKSDVMATNQSRLALIAYYRFVQGLNPLYDMSPEKDQSEAKLTAIIDEIDRLSAGINLADKDAYYQAGQKYYLLNNNDREKITNRLKLLNGLNAIYNLQAALEKSVDEDDDDSDYNGGNGAENNSESDDDKDSENDGDSGAENQNNSSGAGSSQKKSSSTGSSGSSQKSTATSSSSNVNNTTTTTTTNTTRLDTSSFSQGIVPKEEFEKIKGKDENLVLSATTAEGYDYRITFNGSDITTPMEFDMNLANTSIYQAEIESAATDPFVISFFHEGNLPGAALVEFTNSPVPDGETLLFSYEDDVAEVVLVEKIISQAGHVKFITAQAGNYFICQRAKTGAVMAATFDDMGSATAEQSVFLAIPKVVWYILGSLFFLCVLTFLVLWWRIPRFRVKVKELALECRIRLKRGGKIVVYYGKVFYRFWLKVENYYKKHMKSLGKALMRNFTALGEALLSFFTLVRYGLYKVVRMVLQFAHYRFSQR